MFDQRSWIPLLCHHTATSLSLLFGRGTAEQTLGSAWVRSQRWLPACSFSQFLVSSSPISNHSLIHTTPALGSSCLWLITAIHLEELTAELVTGCAAAPGILPAEGALGDWEQLRSSSLTSPWPLLPSTPAQGQNKSRNLPAGDSDLPWHHRAEHTYPSQCWDMTDFLQWLNKSSSPS